MRFFFRSKQFKTVLSIFLILVIISVLSFVVGDRIAPHSDILSTLTAPFRAAFTEISESISDFSKAYNDGEQAILDNAQLKNEIDSLRAQLSELEEIKKQNEFYKDYLEIKDKNPDFVFCDADVIGADGQDPFKGFVINKGSADGISRNDPVITDAGVIGYVTEVGLTSAKVTTILNPELKLGALDNRTHDSGIATGSLSLAKQGLCRFENLARTCNVAVGDYVVTSGEGVFPEGLLIGLVNNIGVDESTNSIYAEIKPFADITEIRSVMVMTSFEGQGGIGGNK